MRCQIYLPKLGHSCPCVQFNLINIFEMNRNASTKTAASVESCVASQFIYLGRGDN